MSYEQKIKVPQFKEELGFYTTEQRSKIMSRIRSTNTKPELQLRKALWALGYRYRVNVRKLPGSPDIVFRRYKLLVFVDGEFWHGYNWEEKKKKIKTNREFWIPKIERNMQRDRQNTEKLKQDGWIVLRYWERQVKKELDSCVEEIVGHLESIQTISK